MNKFAASRSAIDRLVTRGLAALALLLALSIWALPAHADNLTTVRTSTLPALAGPVTSVFAVDGKLIATTGAGSEVLNAERTAWTAFDSKAAGIDLPASSYRTIAVREHDSVLVQDGVVSKRYGPYTEPAAIVADIERLLGA